MSKNTLVDGHFDRVKEILGENTRVRDTLPIMSAEFGFEVTSSKLEKFLAKRNVIASDFINVPKYVVADFEIVTKAQSDEVGLKKRTAYVKKLEKEIANRNYFTTQVQDTLLELFKENPIKLSSSPKPADSDVKERLLTAVVSDWHFGLFVNGNEVTGNSYNWTIAARRMALYAEQIAAWKPNHRDETSLNLIFGGDMIAGLIHRDDVGVRPLAEQIVGASNILIQFVDYLLDNFSDITVWCVTGNHERIEQNGPQFAQRWNTHATAIYNAVAVAFRDRANIQFLMPKTGEAVFDLPGGKDLGFYTHGDIEPKINNLGKTLDLRPLRENLQILNSSGEFSKPVRVFLCGHWHSASVFSVGPSVCVINGSGIGPDSYARGSVNIRGNYGEPMQVLFESTAGHPFGDCRFVRLSGADEDESLEGIITPMSFD